MEKSKPVIRLISTSLYTPKDKRVREIPVEGKTQEELFYNLSKKLWEISISGPPLNYLIIEKQVELIESIMSLKVELPGFVKISPSR